MPSSKQKNSKTGRTTSDNLAELTHFDGGIAENDETVTTYWIQSKVRKLDLNREEQDVLGYRFVCRQCFNTFESENFLEIKHRFCPRC